jgi:hypothetical protein
MRSCMRWIVRCFCSFARRRARLVRVAASEFKRSSCEACIRVRHVGGVQEWMDLVLDLLLLVDFLGDLDGLRVILTRGALDIEADLSVAVNIDVQMSLKEKSTSSRRATRHLSSVLKSPLPSTFMSSQLALTSGVVISSANQLSTSSVPHTPTPSMQRDVPTPSPRPCRTSSGSPCRGRRSGR